MRATEWILPIDPSATSQPNICSQYNLKPCPPYRQVLICFIYFAPHGGALMPWRYTKV